MSTRQLPELSIVMPLYNAGPYLTPAIESVLAQTFRDFELIIIDDVSTDGSLDIAWDFARRDSRIRIIELSHNGGPGIARNKGIGAARGEYIGFFDSDDILPAEAYRSLITFARVNDLDIARGAMADISDKNPEPVKVPPFSTEKRVLSTSAELRAMALCVFSYPTHPDEPDLSFGGSACSAIFRKSMLMDHHIRFVERSHAISEDYLFCFDSLMHCTKVGVVPEIVYHYRTNPLSRSHRPKPDMIDRALETAVEIEQRIEKAGYASRDREYAMRYGIDITRAFLKNFFLSDMPRAELRQWFRKQREHPYLRHCAEDFPVERLPFMHRASFKAFYRGQFMLTRLLIEGRELLRRYAGMATGRP